MAKLTKPVVKLKWTKILGAVEFSDFNLNGTKGAVEITHDKALCGFVLNVDIGKTRCQYDSVFQSSTSAKQFAPKYIKKLCRA